MHEKCFVVCFALLMLLLCGCGGSTAATPETEGGDRAALIPEFPLDELPHYACTNCSSG